MKRLVSLLLTCTFIFSFVGCKKNLLTNKDESTIDDIFDNDEEALFGFGLLGEITLANAAMYPVRGVCDPDAGSVTVVVASPDVTQSFSCISPGVFSGVINVSTVVSNPANVNGSQGSATATANPSPVNGQVGAVTGPTVTGVTVSSTDGDADTWYESGDSISVQVQFSEAVDVDTVGGTPTVPITLTSGSKTATYASGSGSTNLEFTFSIAASDEQCNGTLSLGALALNGGAIRSSSTSEDSNTTGLAGSVGGAKVDTEVPTLTGPVNVTADDAEENSAVTASVSGKADNCGGVINSLMALGEHNGTICSAPTAVAGYQNIGDVTSYQPVSGLAPFNLTNAFFLNYSRRYCTSVRVQDAAGNESSVVSSAGWTYSSTTFPITANIELWLDGYDMADTLNPSTTGTTVTTWVDKSGSSNDGLVVGSPVVSTSAFGGLPSVSFVGTSGYMGASIDAKTMYIVYQPDVSYTDATAAATLISLNNTVQNSVTFGSSTSSFSDEIITFLRQSTPQTRDAISSMEIPMIANSHGHISAIATDADDAFIAHNGSGDIRDLSSGANPNIAGPWRLGSDNGSSRLFNGHIAEVAVFSVKQTATQIETVEGYLACKWDLRDQLPPAHMYYAADPKDNTGCY